VAAHARCADSQSVRRAQGGFDLPGIVDYSGVFPAIDALFTCTPITNEAGAADYGYYWTSTSAWSGT